MKAGAAPAGASSHVLVVGAGIVGASAAYFLRQAGCAVTVLDASTPAAGASGASDGLVSVGSKKPGFLMNIARHARDLYVELTRDGLLEGLFQQRPTFLFARTEAEAELMALHGRDLESAGVRVENLTGAEFGRCVPGVSPAIVGALAVPQDGHALGYQIVDRLLKQSGARVVRHAAVRGIKVDGGRATGVETDAGALSGDAVLVAAGLGSTALAGLGEILVPRKGQIIITDRAADNVPAFAGPLMSAAYLAAKRSADASRRNPVSLVIDPLNTGQLLIGGTREEGQADRETTVRHVSTILREALDAYPPLARRRVIRTFSGVRTASVDGLPIVGRHPAIAGLTIATGFEGDGICLGPLMGKLAARIVAGASCSLDIEALAPARFVAGFDSAVMGGQP
ncbi:NAD(P)/FAD-dependent oxidoreductase [Achromobacter aloeverae]|uniref:FAD-dependent oxidoreductase n=1 Tax=Achromobacter aloeverae TaxID=1750518 RepID=A0A4Q1HCQ6_9BURK|nr:FAD-dependent oxidoreductase [Achromobacter aloeverae]RXN83384.1 FAD-dependent oxidoreductase [Achromobacter aloeverae]